MLYTGQIISSVIRTACGMPLYKSATLCYIFIMWRLARQRDGVIYRQMKKIFTGIIFTSFDFNLNLGGGTLGLIPDFLGYILIAMGLSEMAPEIPSYSQLRPAAIGMAIYTGLLYLLDLFAAQLNLGLFSLLLGLVRILPHLYITYGIVLGIRSLEQIRCCDLNSFRLKQAWTALAVFTILSYVAMFSVVLLVFCVIASFVGGIIFLAAFYRTQRLYQQLDSK